ncbi:unnamed protein product [Ascophyllum nodosum]
MDPAEFQRRIAEAQALKAAQASAAAAAAAAAQQQQQQQGQSQQRAVVSSPPLATPTPSSAAESAGQQQHFMPSPSQHQQQQQQVRTLPYPTLPYLYTGAMFLPPIPYSSSQGFPRAAVKASEPGQDEAGNAVAAQQQQHQPASPPPGLDEAQQHAWQQYQEQYRQWQQQQQQWQQWQEYQQKQQQEKQQPQQQPQQQQPQQQQQPHQQQQPQQQQQPPQQQQQPPQQQHPQQLQHPQHQHNPQQQQQPQQQQHHQPQQQQQRPLQHHQPQPQHQQQSQPQPQQQQPQQHQIFLGMQRVGAACGIRCTGVANVTPMAVTASGARTPTPPVNGVSAPAPAPPPAAAVYGAPQPMVQPPQAVQHPPTSFMQPVAASAYQAIPPQNAFGVPPAYTPPTTFSNYGQQQQQSQQQQQQQPHNQHQHPPAPQQQQLQQHQPPQQQPQLQQLPQHPPFVQQQPQQQPLLQQPLQHQPLQLPQQPQQQQQPPMVMMPPVATPPMGFPAPQPVVQSGYGVPPPVQQMWGQPQSMPQQQQPPQQPPQQQQHHQQLPLPPPVQTPPGITPTPPPLDPKDAERVDKMADYVARNGGNFEEMVREREKDNRMLSFLFGGELHEYYKWALHCARMGFTAEQRHAQIGMYHQHKAIEAQRKTQDMQRMIDAGEMVHGANLAMDPQNEQQFELLLKQLVGSQDSIQASKDWVVSRLGHYAVTIAWRLRAFSKETEAAAGGEGHRALPRNKACEKVIHVLYLVNDVLFAIRHHPAGDIFRAECLRQIPGVLKAACTLGPELTGGSLDKVERIVRLWDSNGVYTTAECNGLLAAAAAVTAKHASAKAMASKAARVLERAGGAGVNSSIIGGSGSLSVGTAGGSGAGTGTLSTDELKGATAEEVMERELARVRKMAEGGPANDGILGLGGVTAVTAATAALTLPSVPNVAPAPATMPACHVAFPWRGALYPVMGKTESQQQLNPATKFPVAAGLASTAHDAGNMLEKLPVGTMAGILRVSLRNGFRRYKPIDLKLLPKYAAPHIEPGRLDVRVDEFYSRATLKLAEEERQKEKERRKMEEEKKNKDGDNNRDRDRSRRNRDAFAGGSGSQGLRAKQAQLELESDQQGREKVLGEENIGHNLLKKMGEIRTGLGSTRSGVVEPMVFVFRGWTRLALARAAALRREGKPRTRSRSIDGIRATPTGDFDLKSICLPTTKYYIRLLT